MTKAEEIIKLINLIPGHKMITLSYNGGDIDIYVITVTISPEGMVFEYISPGVSKTIPNPKLPELDIFKDILTKAIKIHGGIAIRQFINTEIDNKWVPKKKIYGIVLDRGIWIPITKKEVEYASSVDSKTGKFIGYEPDAIYSDLSEFLIDLNTASC